jgi:hypothetical protein
MQWLEVRQAHPNEWLIIEAVEAETLPSHQRNLKRIAVVERCSDGGSALQTYRVRSRDTAPPNPESALIATCP